MFKKHSSDESSVIIGYNKKNKPVEILRDDKFTSTLIVGPAGSGKTTQSLIPMIQQDIRKQIPMGITVFEPNGDLTARIYADIKEQNDCNKTVLWFNPTLEDCVYFNPLNNNLDDAKNYLLKTIEYNNYDIEAYKLLTKIYIKQNEIEEIIASKDRKRAGITARPEGLYLNKVFY